MKTKINLWSFIFSFVCVALFFIAASSSNIVNFVTNVLHIHPLNIVLGMSFITFLFGLIGLSASANWKSLIRSILTIIITLGLSVFTLYILAIGNLFKFT